MSNESLWTQAADCGGLVTVTAEEGAFRVVHRDDRQIYADTTFSTLRKALIEAANLSQ